MPIGRSVDIARRTSRMGTALAKCVAKPLGTTPVHHERLDAAFRPAISLWLPLLHLLCHLLASAIALPVCLPSNAEPPLGIFPQGDTFLQHHNL